MLTPNHTQVSNEFIAASNNLSKEAILLFLIISQYYSCDENELLSLTHINNKKILNSAIEELLNNHFIKYEMFLKKYYLYYENEKIEKAVLKKNKPKTNGYVYILSSNKGHKIGVSKNLHSRKKQFDRLPIKYEFVYYKFVKNNYFLEKKLHSIFSKKRLVGEWFDLTEEEVRLAIRLIEEHSNEIHY